MAGQAETNIDWRTWLKRWDDQQTGYLPDREARFDAMLDVLEVLMPDEFVALDLACGPGSMSQRLLQRFPNARCVAVDFDPILLMMGEAVLGDADGRLRWIRADIEVAGWDQQLGETQFDAVLSTTALHWLTAGALNDVYRILGRLIRPEGVFLNGDNMSYPPNLSTFRRLAVESTQWRKDENAKAADVEGWQEWWEAIGAEPELEELFEERNRRFARHDDRQSDDFPPIYDVHVASLLDAGFREVGTVWQRHDDRVLMAVR